MFDLTFLGTAATMPAAERGLPALLVGAGSDRYLIDCGEGTQRQMLRAGAGFRRLNHILLTHPHLDHILGIAGLLSTLGLLDLKGDLAICGSAPTLSQVQRLLEGLWGPRRAPVALRLVPIEPGLVAEGRDYRLSCFPVKHHDTASLGYRFDAIPRRHLDAERLNQLDVPSGPLRARLAAGESIELPDGRRIEPEMVQGAAAAGVSLAVVGDTEETASLTEAVRGVDALVIEATFLEADAALAAERGHLTAAAAGRLAAAAGVGALYLQHISGRYDAAAVEAEAARFFAGAQVMNDFDHVAVVTARSHHSDQRRS